MARRKTSKKSPLAALCASKGMTVTQLARRIHRARNTLYLAMERPSRYPETYRLIAQETQ